MSIIPSIDPKKETERITKFIQKTLNRQRFQNLVLGLSGGVDSCTSLYLLKKALSPTNIIITYLYHFRPEILKIKNIVEPLKIPEKQIYFISIKNIVDLFQNELTLKNDAIRLGNIMARVRMIILYDLAKKNKAMVCGTENRSEHLLGYFTRFGDAASDMEPIQHLYKTQILQLAQFLGVPKTVIDQPPSANLWEHQTDEGEFGFTYKEADEVLYLHFEKKINADFLIRKGHRNAKKIIAFAQKNSFKHRAPYSLLHPYPFKRQ